MSVFVGFPINKTYPRYLDPRYFIKTQLRCLLLFILPTNLSFPITINFFGEMPTLVAIVSMDIYFRFISILSNYISTPFWLLIMNRKWSHHSYYLVFKLTNVIVNDCCSNISQPLLNLNYLICYYILSFIYFYIWMCKSSYTIIYF